MEMEAVMMVPRLGISNANQLFWLIGGFPAENPRAVVAPMTDVFLLVQEIVTGVLPTNAPRHAPCPVAVIVIESPRDNELSANTTQLTIKTFQLAPEIMASPSFSFCKKTG